MNTFLTLTRGVGRFKIVLSKSLMLLSLWTLLYWFSFIITYLANEILWDNGIAHNILFSCACIWIIGIFIIALLILFSVIFSYSNAVLASCAGVFLLIYLTDFLPKIKDISPSKLLSAGYLISGSVSSSEYYIPFIISAFLSITLISAAIPLFNKKQI